MTTQTVRAAERLGVPAVRIDLVPRALPADEFLPFALRVGRSLCEATRKSKVRFGIENHGRVTNDPDFLEALLAGVGSERTGLTPDTANFYWWGQPLDALYGIYDAVRPPRGAHALQKHRLSDRSAERSARNGLGIRQILLPALCGRH